MCDQSPPAPLPPVRNTLQEFAAAYRIAVGLYRDEITKDRAERACRAAVRAENAAAAKAAR